MPSAIKNEVYKTISYDPAVDKQITDYVYNEKKKKPAYELGISSYGTLVQMTERYNINKVLACADAGVDTAFVMGSYINHDERRALVLFGTVRTGMMAFEQMAAGYGEGQISADITFKIFKEAGLDMMTFNVQDVACHGKTVAFGPTTHQDAPQFKAGGTIIHSFVTLLMQGVASRSLPNAWSTAVKNLIYERYAVKIDDYCERLHPGQLPTYDPADVCADDDMAIPNGLRASPLGIMRNKTDWPHLSRAIYDNRHKLKNQSQDRIDLLMEHMGFLHESYDIDLLEHQKRLTLAKWRGWNEDAIASYLESTKFNRRFSRCHSVPGVATDTCSLEAFHGKTLKAMGGFESLEGLGTGMEHSITVMSRVSRDMGPLALVPPPKQKVWQAAQKLVARGWQNLGLKLGASFMFPSEHLLELIPKEKTTAAQRVAFIKTWANEYAAMRRNPKGYYKLTDGSWDIDVLNDMMFSFHVLTKVPDDHIQQKTLAEAGILYTCDCPNFAHYHVCKHCLAFALFKKETAVPLRFSTDTVGKRKAPAGASLSKRTRCLVID